MALKDEIVTYGGTTWKIREARDWNAAFGEIVMARVTGSVGSRRREHMQREGESMQEFAGRIISGEGDVVIADVVALNDDGTERQPA